MHLGGDIRYAARQLGKAQGFAAIALAALALGIGATTAIFSVVDTVLLKPLPFRDPDRLLALWEKDPALGRDRNFVAPVNFLEWRKQSRTVETMAAIQDLRINIGGGFGEPEEVKAERVSAALFPMLGVQPAPGRAFLKEEDQPGSGKVAIIGHSLWQRRFGGDRVLTGKSLRVRGGVYTVVGVLPSGFSILEPGVEVWMPLVLNPADSFNNGRYVAVIGLRRAGASLQQVRHEMDRIGEQSERDLPAVNAGWRPSIFGLQEELVFDVQRPLWVLMGACSLLLLMSCVNVANLLLVRGSGRRKEIATRSALGAPRSRLIAQLLSESVMLALGGGLIGLMLGGAAVAIVARAAPADVPRIGQAALDLRLFTFALAASVLSGMLFGIVPALHGSRGDLSGALNEGGRGGSSGRTGRAFRHGLAVLEVAIAVVVLIGSGLLIRSFIRLRTASPGFDPAGVLTLRVPLGGGRNSAPDRRLAFTAALIERISAMPGVSSVAAINGLPLNGLGNGADFNAEGGSGPPPIHHPNGLLRSVTTGYFRTMRIPLIAGRFFTDADTKDSKPVALINQTLARQSWHGENPVGRHMTVQAGDVRNVEIVGVVGDVKPDRFETEDWPMIYYANPQAPANTVSLVVRTSGPPPAIGSAILREIRGLDPEQVVAEMRPISDLVDRAIAGARFNTALLAIFAGIAFLLASVGIYGVISYDVTERTNEIGIRMALGAQPGDVLRLVMGQGARLAAGGIVIGLAGAFALTRLMSTMLYGVEPHDAWTFAAISILLAAVALAASYIPSRRAMSLDPVAALRHQ